MYQAWDDGPEVITMALLREISLLTPGVEPAEKLARVAYAQETPALREAETMGEVRSDVGRLLYRPNTGIGSRNQMRTRRETPIGRVEPASLSQNSDRNPRSRKDLPGVRP